MANVHILFLDAQLVGVYSTQPLAQQVEAALNASQAQQTRIERVEIDYPVTHLNSAELQFQVSWRNITNANSRRTKQLSIKPLGRHRDQDVVWDSATRRFSVLVWALDKAAAESEADGVRTTFITANSL